MKKRFLSLLLMLCMLLSLLPTTALAVGGSDTENTGSWANCETCSEANPHMISTKADLNKIRTHITTEDGKQVISGYFKLANDIAFDASDFAENGEFYNDGQGWLPLDGVGWINNATKPFYSTRFTGTLDGDKHTISGIISNAGMSSDASNSAVYNKDKETAIDAYSTGLFSYIKNGTVKNLTLKSFKLYENEDSPRFIAGALSGYVEGATIENVTVLDSEMYGANCGGIAGYGALSSFTRCTVANTVIHSEGDCGGIIGWVRFGMTVKNCDVDIEIQDLPNEKRENRSWNGGIWGSHGVSSWGYSNLESKIENVNVKFKYSSENQGGVGGLIGGCYSKDEESKRIIVTINNAVVDVDIDTGINMSKVGGIFGQVTSTKNRSTKSTISNVIVRGTINSGNDTSGGESTVSAIGWCHGKWSNTGAEEPSNVLKNIYVSITKTGDRPLPAITYSDAEETPYPFSMENVVFAGQETIDGIDFPAGSSYKVYKNSVEIAYGEENSQWLTTIGSLNTAETVSIEDDSIISNNDSDKLCGKKLGKTNIVVKVNMNDKDYTLAKIPVTVSHATVAVTMTDLKVDYDGTAKTINAVAESAPLPDDLKLEYSYKASDADDSTYTHIPPTTPGTYTVKVESGSDNYTLTGTTTAKLTISPPSTTDVSDSVTVTAPGSLVYDGSAKSYTAAYEGITEWTYTYYDADGNKLDTAPVNAGSYAVTITGSNNSSYAVKTVEFTITKATLTIAANNQSIYVGDALPTFTYTTTGLVDSDTLSTEPALNCSADGKTAGSFDIIPSGADAGSNYDITYQNGTLTVYRPSSGGSSSIIPAIVIAASQNKTPLELNTAEHMAYVNGYPDGTVKPNGKITRAEVAAILYRIMDTKCVSAYSSTRSGFSDVDSGKWYNTYVATLNNAGIITDSQSGYFRPDDAITRAELAAMLGQFVQNRRAANYFSDVSADHWAAIDIAVCANMGWINGYPDGTFRPDATITRAEMMAMVNRALERTPQSVSDLLPGMKTWSDNASTSAWYYLDVQEATNGHTYTKSGSKETWQSLTSVLN